MSGNKRVSELYPEDILRNPVRYCPGPTGRARGLRGLPGQQLPRLQHRFQHCPGWGEPTLYIIGVAPKPDFSGYPANIFDR